MDGVGGSAKGRVDGRTRMEKRIGRQVDRRTCKRVQGGGQADERMGTGTLGGRADRGGRGQTVADRFRKGKTPKLTRQLTWPLEIQRGCLRVTV